MKRLLLSSAMRPFGERYGDAFSCTANGAFQLTWAQGAFSTEDNMWHWGLDLIARNISIPTVVLHFPDRKTFVREIKKGYDYIGLSFNLCTFHKLKEQVRLVRKHSPQSRIILGGYGTILPDEIIGEWGDHICRGEGLSYMRTLLGEPERLLVHPRTAVIRRMFSISSGEKTGVIFSSMGCPNGCEFCITSHYYHGKQVRFLQDGHAVYNAMMAAQDAAPECKSFMVIDEDFLVDEGRGREFLESAREHKRFFDVMIFSSIRSLSRFDAQEIAEMGITRVWLGFEAEESGYGKQEGRQFEELIADLKSWGITATVSMIIGYDYQDEPRIHRELERVIRAQPSATQVMIFSPCYGTPAWNRLEREKRILPSLRSSYSKHDGYTLLFSHPHIAFDRMNALVRESYIREYRALGPTLFRFLRTLHEAYPRLTRSASPVLQRRAFEIKNRFQKALVIYPLGILFGPTKRIRADIRHDYRGIIASFGLPSLLTRCVSAIAVGLYVLTKLRFRYRVFVQPRESRKEYRTKES